LERASVKWVLSKASRNEYSAGVGDKCVVRQLMSFVADEIVHFVSAEGGEHMPNSKAAFQDLNVKALDAGSSRVAYVEIVIRI